MISSFALSLNGLAARAGGTLAERGALRHPAPEDEPLYRESATRLAAQIASGERSSLEVVEAHIRFARQVNPLLNAIVAERFDQARCEAEAIDDEIAAGREVGPLGGVPCTIKESFALQGMPNAAGVVARRHLRSERDAVTVKRWRQAGAIPIGVTNTPELCMWYETHNHLYGRTSNAYSEAHISGGSSGGEGAIVGAGASPFGLGSDVGGSIRMPAFFNGVFGHKPTGGLVPSSGQYPRSQGDALRYLCTGPLCRRAEDLYPLLALLAGDDGVDPGIRPDLKLRDPAEVNLSDLTVYTIDTNGSIEPSEEIKQSVHRAAEALESRGAQIEETSFIELASSFDIWSSMLNSSNSGPTFRELLHQDQPHSLMRDLLDWSMRRSPHTLPAILLAMTESVTRLLERRMQHSVKEGARLKQALTERLGSNAVLLYPPFPTVAPRHMHSLIRPAHFVYTAIFNVLEFPVTQIPVGLNEQGLPLGVQVIAPHGRDDLSLACALALEEELGGWRPPWLGPEGSTRSRSTRS